MCKYHSIFFYSITTYLMIMFLIPLLINETYGNEIIVRTLNFDCLDFILLCWLAFVHFLIFLNVSKIIVYNHLLIHTLTHTHTHACKHT